MKGQKRRAPSALVPSEHDSQCAFFRRVSLDRRTRDIPIFAIPNGGHRHLLTAIRLKAEGVRAGVPDIFCAEPKRGRPGLFIEMKRKPNRPTDEQVTWATKLNNRGYDVVTCYSADEAWNALCEYLNIDPR